MAKIKLYVTSLPEADAIKHSFLGSIVSLIDLNLERKPISEKQLVVNFDDVTYVKPEEFLALKDKIQGVFKFVDDRISAGEKTFLVHCHAGISRSTALAIGMHVIYNNKTFEDAFKDIHDQRPHMWPNQSVIETLELLYPEKCDGLLEYLATWKGSSYSW